MITMKYKTGEVIRYNFTSQDKLFLDANIWLYLFGPREPRNHWNQIYSRAFNRILNANSQIYIDGLVVSEFINAYARTKWRAVASHVRSFKDFRSSAGFKPIAGDIAAAVEQIMRHCVGIESGFTTLPMNVSAV